MQIKIIWGYIYTGFLVLLVLAAVTGVLEPYAYSGSWESAPIYIKLGIPTIMLFMFGFFVLMLADFFSHRDVKRPILVGFSLLFFSWLAILLYFWTVVKARKI